VIMAEIAVTKPGSCVISEPPSKRCGSFSSLTTIPGNSGYVNSMDIILESYLLKRIRGSTRRRMSTFKLKKMYILLISHEGIRYYPKKVSQSSG